MKKSPGFSFNEMYNVVYSSKRHTSFEILLTTTVIKKSIQTVSRVTPEIFLNKYKGRTI